MRVIFTDSAWADYIYWQEQDRKILKRINNLIKETLRTPFEGSGKPEPLKFQLQGCWSRRITQEHRLVYKVTADDIMIISCRFHYDR